MDNLIFSFKTVHLKNEIQNLGCLKTVEPASRRAGSKMFNWKIMIMEAIDNNNWLKARASFFRHELFWYFFCGKKSTKPNFLQKNQFALNQQALISNTTTQIIITTSYFITHLLPNCILQNSNYLLRLVLS